MSTQKLLGVQLELDLGQPQKPIVFLLVKQQGSESWSFEGVLHLGEMQWGASVIQQKDQTSGQEVQIFSASYQAQPGTEAGLNDLLKLISPKLAEDLDSILSLKFASAQLLSWGSQGKGKQKSRNFFRVRLKLKTKLSLKDLPLLGSMLAHVNLPLDDLPLILSLGAFNAAEVKLLNQTLGKAQEIQLKEIKNGFDLESQLQLAPPLASGESPGTPAPVAAPTPAKSETFYLKGFGFDFKDEKITVRFTAGVRLPVFGLELIDAGLQVPLKSLTNFKEYRPFLRGFYLAAKIKEYGISGGFLKLEKEKESYAGQLNLQLPILALRAIGIYGKVDETFTLFLYAMLKAGKGMGLRFDPVTITGLAIGGGYNRRAIVPDQMSQLRQFSLIALATGQRDLPNEGDFSGPLKKLGEEFIYEKGQYLGCLGIAFTLAEMIDGFVLALVQFGNVVELEMLGLAQLEKPICSVELLIRISFKPNEGRFLAQAQLTENSWLLDRGCKLTGGFAFAFWTAGEHKGDFIVTVGGYHPEFRPPQHYPQEVPRLGLNWQISSQLSIKGGLYFALTPSMLMAGGKLEVAYHWWIIRAWLTADANFLMGWAPLRYKAKVVVELHAQVAFPVKDLSGSARVELNLWGPPFAGYVSVRMLRVEITIEFGPRSEGETFFPNWESFCRNVFTKAAFAERPWVLTPGTDCQKAPGLFQMHPLRGLLVKPGVSTAKPAASEGTGPAPWLMRGDELEFSIVSLIPLTLAQYGAFQKVPAKAGNAYTDGQSWLIRQPLSWQGQAFRSVTGPDLMVGPMHNKPLRSELKVSLVKEVPGNLSEVKDLEMESEHSNLSSALWGEVLSGKEAEEQNPSAKVIRGGLLGFRRFRPKPLPPEVPVKRLLHAQTPEPDLKRKYQRASASPASLLKFRPRASLSAAPKAKSTASQKQVLAALEAEGWLG